MLHGYSNDNYIRFYGSSLRQKWGIKMPLGNPLNKGTHCVRKEHTVRTFPLIDALGKSNIYRNVMA